MPYLALGGVDTILHTYLNFLARETDYEIHLAILEESHHNISQIDKRVHKHFILNDIETQFLRFCNAKIKDNEINESDKRYFKSWLDHISNVRLKRLQNLFETHQCDVFIDFHNLALFHLNEEFVNSVKVPMIHWIHSNAAFNNWSWNKEYYKKIFAMFSAIVAICEDMKVKADEKLNEFFNLPLSSTFLYNPINSKTILAKSCETVSDSDRILLQQPFLLQVSRLENSQKNLTKLIELYSKLKEKGVKEKLYIIGDGPSKELLQNKIAELNLQDDCLLLGARSNPFPFMKNAKLFLHTANWEGLCTVLLESMVCDVPIVAFDCPTGTREILGDGKYGGLIPMGDDSKFIETTYQLLQDEVLRQSFIARFPEALKPFQLETVGKQFIQLIEQVSTKYRHKFL